MEKVGTAFSVFDCQCWGHYSKKCHVLHITFLKSNAAKIT